MIVSCEHGGKRIPARLAPLFAGQERVLASHRGFDAGAASLARHLARRLGAPLHVHLLSRLLVDANRSLGHPRLFSERTRTLPEEERARILARCWQPHRDAVEGEVRVALRRGARVLHLSVHSFSPRLAGRSRGCDVGLLYDPSRPRERELCARWRAILLELAPGLRVRRNHPYRGDADGFTTHLRGRFADPAYAGIELEVNQGRLRSSGARELELTLAASLRLLLDDLLLPLSHDLAQ
ncbi:MAG: N-formylglutamate amidohydrolase [Myxococcales bacterium]|nr:MAG: N-formylglutamate amidohydrolase [Myxococcales bacterium]